MNRNACIILNIYAKLINIVSSLIQVQAVTRHGARTPYAHLSCWKNYDKQIHWNTCNVTELMITSPSYTSQDRPGKFLYRKIYDGSPTSFGGTCETGQLIYEGYQQELALGTALRNAYILGENKLFSELSWNDIVKSSIYLRSDDSQRTLMSGQISIHGMFYIDDEAIIDWHTGDYLLDQIYPNSNVCPRLDEVKRQAYLADEWQNHIQSRDYKFLTNRISAIFGTTSWTWNTILDCLMTTVCSDQQISDGNTTSKNENMSDEMFDAIVKEVEYSYSYAALFNNSLYSKLAMGNTAWHIRNNIENAIQTPTEKSLKFALFAAHDTTIMPFLASILGNKWDREWAGYASMITIEVYNASSPQFLFRIVYNGKELQLNGCNEPLCDLAILLEALEYGQEHMPCSAEMISNTPEETVPHLNENSLDYTDLLIVCIVSLLIGGLIGAASIILSYKREIDNKSLFASNAAQDSDQCLIQR